MIKTIRLVIIILILTSCTQDSAFTKTELIFNTPVSISIYENDKNNLLQKSFAICSQYEKQFSVDYVISEVYALNNSNGETIEISSELKELLEYSLYFSELTNGMFDVTVKSLVELWDFRSENPYVPEQFDIYKELQTIGYKNIIIKDFYKDEEGNLIEINANDVIDQKMASYNVVTTATMLNNVQVDLGGIAKGYIANQVREFLIESNVQKAIIDIGGNIVTVGSKSKDQGFEIGIRKPFGEVNEIIASIEVSDMSVVTSGSYERSFIENDVLYHHILDPKTGFPVDSGIISSTIITTEPLIADALSTACFLIGVENGIELIEGIMGTEAIFVKTNGEIIVTSGIGEIIPITYY